ncbi:helix-turn-helix domain-containing protein [Enterococcus gallinarum]|uniref:helix-turn-helix domain-containing protein n=1 Tax=Enterococcus gallinarum TaxID=1353 RepID=UPI001D10FABF|nr:helix-turn-helix transcriptional regulator [Enterococcus gallinarum]MCC2752690.1 helix-turn-helix domain-containing protein [Enterococcus gallinarum]
MNEFNIRQIGQRIASKRRELNMTQSNLADQLLVSYQAISNWERGNTLPDIEKLSQLATILQLSIDELLGNSGVAVMHYHEGVADSQEITTLAPIIKPKELAAATQAQPFELELVEQLAPFLSSEELFALLKPITEPLTEEALEEFLPFFRDRSFGTIDERGLYFRFSGRSSALLICHFLSPKS